MVNQDEKFMLTLQPSSAVFIPKCDRSVGTGCAECTMLLVKAGVEYDKRGLGLARISVILSAAYLKCLPDVINGEYEGVLFFALRRLFPPMAFKREIRRTEVKK